MSIYRSHKDIEKVSQFGTKPNFTDITTETPKVLACTDIKTESTISKIRITINWSAY